eukprot:scaffold23658_cov61-Phaeocystis_antarctica.AAC.8
MVLRPELPSPSPAQGRGASTAHATAPPQEPAEVAEATGAAGAGECQGAGGWPLVRRRFSCQHSLRRFSLQSKQGSGGSTQGEGRTATRGSLTSAAGLHIDATGRAVSSEQEKQEKGHIGDESDGGDDHDTELQIYPPLLGRELPARTLPRDAAAPAPLALPPLGSTPPVRLRTPRRLRHRQAARGRARGPAAQVPPPHHHSGRADALTGGALHALDARAAQPPLVTARCRRRRRGRPHAGRGGGTRPCRDAERRDMSATAADAAVPPPAGADLAHAEAPAPQLFKLSRGVLVAAVRAAAVLDSRGAGAAHPPDAWRRAAGAARNLHVVAPLPHPACRARFLDRLRDLLLQLRHAFLVESNN